jgi:hypothetical protein
MRCETSFAGIEPESIFNVRNQVQFAQAGGWKKRCQSGN